MSQVSYGTITVVDTTDIADVFLQHCMVVDTITTAAEVIAKTTWTSPEVSWFMLTTDTTVNINKRYYRLNNNNYYVVIPTGSENPSSNNWYEDTPYPMWRPGYQVWVRQVTIKEGIELPEFGTPYLDSAVNQINAKIKKMWTNSSGIYMASGIGSGEIDTSSSSTYGFNSRVTTTQIGFNYNDIPLIETGVFSNNNEVSGGIRLYSPTLTNGVITSSRLDAVLGSDGLKLLKGGVEAGDKNTNNYIYVYSDDDAINHTLTINNSGSKSDWRIIAGNKFGVDKAGNLYAAGAHIEGDLHASSLSTGTKTSITTGTGVYIDGNGNIYAGSGSDNIFSITANNGLTASGNLIATDGFIVEQNDKVLTSITANGMIVYDGIDDDDPTNVVARFGTTTTIGNQSGAHLEFSPTRMYGMNSDLVDYFEIKNNAIDVGTNYEYKQTITLSTTSTVITLYGADKIYDSQEIGSFDDYPDAGKIGLSMHTADDFYPFEFTFGESNTQTYSTEDNILITASYDGESEFTLTSTDNYECTPTFIYNFLEIAPSYNFGNDNLSNSPYSVTIGANNKAYGRCAIAIGLGNRVDEEYAVAIGLGNHVNGYCSYAEGAHTRANGHYAHAEGSSTVAGYVAHAEGYNTNANGQYSHAEGYNSIARGASSHAGGSGTIAAKDNQTVIGKYNVTDTETAASKQQAFIIGNGVSGSNRSNALTVDWSGNVQSYSQIADSSKTSYDAYDYSHNYAIIDKTGDTIGAVGNHIYANGAIGSFLTAGRTINGTKKWNSISANIDNSGNYFYGITDPRAFCSALDLGETLSHEPAATTCATGKYMQLAYLTVTPGTWLLMGSGQFPYVNTTGIRRIYMSTATSGYNNVTTAPASLAMQLYNNVAPISGNIPTYVNSGPMPITFTSNTIVRLIGFQNSGSNISVTGRIYAVRLA